MGCAVDGLESGAVEKGPAARAALPCYPCGRLGCGWNGWCDSGSKVGRSKGGGCALVCGSGWTRSRGAATWGLGRVGTVRAEKRGTVSHLTHGRALPARARPPLRSTSPCSTSPAQTRARNLPTAPPSVSPPPPARHRRQVSAEDYIAAKPDPVAQFAAPVCGHMNAGERARARARLAVRCGGRTLTAGRPVGQGRPTVVRCELPCASQPPPNLPPP